jgi:hypothetical protein
MQHVSFGVTPKCRLLSPGVTWLHRSAGWTPWPLNLGVTARGGPSTRLQPGIGALLPFRFGGDAVVQRDEDRTAGKVRYLPKFG